MLERPWMLEGLSSSFVIVYHAFPNPPYFEKVADIEQGGVSMNNYGLYIASICQQKDR